jgi:hypothetical protein
MSERKIGGGGWAFFAMVALMFAYEGFRQYQLHYNARYTAIKLTDTYYTAHGVKKVEFTFNIANEVYRGEASYSKYNKPGDDKKRFYVRFSSEFPWINRLLDTIPATVGNPPPDGWLTLPTPSEER